MQQHSRDACHDSTASGVLRPVSAATTLAVVAKAKETRDPERGERIKLAYQRAGMNRNQFMQKVGTTYSNVMRWERGAFPRDHISKIAEVTGRSETWILKGEDAERVEPADELIRTGLHELISDWDPDTMGPPPSDAEARKLATNPYFRGAVIKEALRAALYELRREEKGRPSASRPELAPPAPRPGRRKLANRKGK